ncbi:hypothetical protein A2690_04520 [Candidatus Roizmanbacteria bacterium RIFCSPHIGHO2_01_FULL_39_12b]|uniref:Antitoxin n=1 Tax=Candidatus Roizmanbacteria bacterium RIFCSPHIGHO2_01_FULL_39_12b TaxID=1802030 RepID=A0A1F7GAE8_9BACT|nr:MAG: hypothetical protein A2690_04520 [Candidatus Roizmanbacteria bacterium RIFCSPHIGHO2_01_FULL_39_12b]
MNKISVSATDLKNNVSDILNTVYFEKTTAVIERHGKPIAFIIPAGKPDKEKIAKALKETFGLVPDFPNVVSKRYLRKRDVRL